MSPSVPLENPRAADAEGNVPAKPTTDFQTNDTATEDTGFSTEDSFTEDAANLIPDVLETIFSYLDLASKGRAGQVCHTWRNVMNQPSVFRQETVQVNSNYDPELLTILAKRGIRRVNFNYQCQLDGNALLDLVGALPRLSSLLISCGNLQDLYRIISDETMSAALLEKMPQLNQLEMVSAGIMTHVGVERICQKLTNLSTLRLGFGVKLNDVAFRSIVSGLGGLKNIQIRWGLQLTDKSIEYLAGLGQELVRKPNLESLDLRGCGGLTDQSLRLLSHGQKNIKKLNLSYVRQLTDSGLVHLIRLPYLEDLVLSDCNLLSDHGMLHIAKLANLRRFEAPTICDEGLAFLAQGGESKIEILLLSCSPGNRITPVGAGSLSMMSHLRHLELPKFSQVTSGGLKHLAGLASLRKLHILKGRTTDDSLAELAQGGSKITSLVLSGCVCITARGLDHLYTMSSLEGIYVEKCKAIPYQGWLNLTEGRRRRMVET